MDSSVVTGEDFLLDLDRKPKVFIDGDYIVIDAAYRYTIPADNCRTAEQVLDWVLQLSEKNWASVSLIEEFVRFTCSQNQLNVRSYGKSSSSG